MNQLNLTDLSARELDYRSNLSIEDLALKYQIDAAEIESWHFSYGWTRNGPPERVLQLKMQAMLEKVEAMVSGEELDMANAYLKTMTALLKTQSEIAKLWTRPAPNQTERQDMNERDFDPDEHLTLEELKEQLRQDLRARLGLEVKSDRGHAGSADFDAGGATKLPE